MKKIIALIFFFACFLGLQAQDYEYIITPYGSLFSLDIIEISENERDTTISRKGQLDTASVQAQMYSELRQAYNRIARYETAIREQTRLRNTYTSALNSVSLNDYNAFADSTVSKQLNGNWRVKIGENIYLCDIESNTGLLRISADDTSGESENTAVGALNARSRLYIVFNPRPDFETVTDENVTLYSSDGRNYYGEDSQGAVYRLKKIIR